MHNLYLNLPWWVQNAALSAYGRLLYKERFGGKKPGTLESKAILKTPDSEDIVQQNILLRALLTYCKDYIPFYQPFLKNLSLDEITAENLKDILPIIDKSIVQSQADSFITQHPNHRKQLLKLHTSGSSGSPLTVYATKESRKANYANYQQILSIYNCDYRDRSTTFAGRILFNEVGNRPDRYDFYNQTQYLSSYFISESSIHDYIRTLNSWQPKFIDSYPSAILSLVSLAKHNNLSLNFSPKFVLTSSENLSDAARTTIEEFFSAPVIDHYGCTEMAISAISTGSSYYIFPLYSIVEFEPAFEDFYSVITTGLLNFGMPLLRYRIGDLAQGIVSNHQFARVAGRADDIILTPSGKQIGRMDPAFKGVNGIIESQIIQTDLNKLKVLIVCDKDAFNENDKTTLIHNINTRTNNEMDISIEKINEIPRGSNGKFKSVVSKISIKPSANIA